MAYVPLPSYNPGNALDFSGVSNALSQIQQQKNANRQYGLEQQASARADESLGLQKQQVASSLKSAALDQEKTYAQLTGGWAQTALDSKDPATIQKTWDGIKASHPEFSARLQQHGIDPNDPVGGLSFITAEARGYQNPLDVKLREAQIAGAQSENAIRGKQWGQVGRDMYGQPTFGVVDLTQPNAGRPQQAADATGQPVQPPGQGPTGADYLKTLPKPMADQVQAIAEGRIPIPGGFALKTPYWQQMMTHVSQYDPTFDSVNYNARAKTRNDFTSGKSAQNITSFNTAIGHLDELSHAVDKLDNGDIPALNAATNATAKVGNADRAAKLAAFDTAKNAVVEELTRAFKGTGGSLTEVQEWGKLIDSSQSPAALRQVIKTAVNLLASRIDSVGEQYSKGMGTTADPIKLLSPKAQKLWMKFNGKQDAPETPPSSVAAPGVTHVWDPTTGLRAVGGQ